MSTFVSRDRHSYNPLLINYTNMTRNKKPLIIIILTFKALGNFRLLKIWDNLSLCYIFTNFKYLDFRRSLHFQILNCFLLFAGHSLNSSLYINQTILHLVIINPSLVPSLTYIYFLFPFNSRQKWFIPLGWLGPISPSTDSVKWACEYISYVSVLLIRLCTFVTINVFNFCC